LLERRSLLGLVSGTNTDVARLGRQMRTLDGFTVDRLFVNIELLSDSIQGRIMVPPAGPDARKRLRDPSTYICNIDLILFLFFTVTLFA